MIVLGPPQSLPLLSAAEVATDVTSFHSSVAISRHPPRSISDQRGPASRTSLSEHEHEAPNDSLLFPAGRNPPPDDPSLHDFHPFGAATTCRAASDVIRDKSPIRDRLSIALVSLAPPQPSAVSMAHYAPLFEGVAWLLVWQKA
jgi:hypothetical protein